VSIAVGESRFLARGELDRLISHLRSEGRNVIAPTVEDGVIVYDEITSSAALPMGIGEEAGPGTYRLTDRGDDRLFDHNVGPSSPKRFVFPPRTTIIRAERGEDGVAFAAVEPAAPSLAILGVRSCELAALGISDRVFLGGPYTEDDYRVRRSGLFLVAIECATAASTCFCTSMGTGPEAREGFDLALTEIARGFLVRTGSADGARVVDALRLPAATLAETGERVAVLDATVASMPHSVETAGLHDRLLAKLDSPRWAEVAERCLYCTSCTAVCPTCFCTGVTQTSDLDGGHATSERVWDSCMLGSFAVVAGDESFRSRPKDRYRQWLTHKFATWVDQFGTFGCVGCGRCIAWCPAGIDVRDELHAIAPPPTAPVVVAAEPQEETAGAEYVTVRVTEVHRETPDMVTLTLRGLDAARAGGRPGQFLMVAIPGQPPAAISISRYLPPDGVCLTIRAAGPATTVLTELVPGDTLGVRGPVGVGWPLEAAYGRDVTIVTGGSGLAPLRELIVRILAERERFGEVRLYYGARTAESMLFADELRGWAARDDVDVTCRWLASGGAGGGVGRSTVSSIHQADWDGANTIAFVCGPDRMMQAVSGALAVRGVTADRTYVTMERRMECGIGLCGHCQMGRFFICKDGPVFRLDTLGETFGREGA
jgi:NAD(P)H-flavin reductase